MQRLLFQFCNREPINPVARVEINHFHIMVSYYYFHDSMSLSPGTTPLLQQCKWKTGLYDKETSRRSMFHCVTTLFKYFWTLCCKWPEEHSCCFSIGASYDTGISSKASGINKSLWGKMTGASHWLSLSRYSKLGASNLCSWSRFFVNSFSISMTSPW